ncbi:unnamed protein product [Cylindrotheca closterium]|uniref:PHD-type domain-containing protein n=1 Tax=Cylindrotheca closterium TaxID=2856 RepID=A0AAD2G9X8_9STRA|nr:unnamed protein product [Cylindrotheca closterium]
MHILESPLGSNVRPQEPTAFPRRDPRIGSQFQTKILQNCTKNDGRRPPDRISHEHVYSYCCYDSKMDSNEDDSTEEQAVANSTSMTATRPIPAPCDLEASLQTETVPRGGLKVHSPSTEAHRFAQSVEPMVLSLASSYTVSNPTTTILKNSSLETTGTSNNKNSPTKGYTFKGGNETPEGFMASSQNEDWRKDVFWQKYMLQLQGRVADRSKKRRPQRGARKRRRGSNTSEDSTVSDGATSDMPVCLEEMVEEQQLIAPQFGEDMAHSMAFLHYYHNGNAKAANMRLFTNLTAGKASKRRKLVKLKRLQQKKLPSIQSSESWRRVYEQTQLMSIIDHLEQTASIPYALQQQRLPQNQSTAKEGSNGDVIMLDAAETSKDDLKEAWTSILSIGRSVKDQLDGWETAGSKTKTDKKIACSALLAFIRNAYRLEPPEVCFGSNHVMIEEVSYCLLAILEHIESARSAQAEIRDKLYQESITTGSDSDALQKYVQELCKVLPIRLDEVSLLEEFRDVVIEWEGKLASSRETTNKDDEGGDLEAAKQMALEARSHGYVSKEMIDLQVKIEKSRELKQKILEWKQLCDEGNGGTMRTVSALAKELKKLKLDFAEKRDFLEFYTVVQNWLDRTNIAIRSRMSFVEVRALLTQGADFPLDLAEYVGKLKSRVSSAEAWLERLEDLVPCPKTASGEHDMLEWSKGMRSALHDGQQGLLQDMVSDGSRMPVEVEALKVLQVEIDAKNWISKAQKWLPINEDSKKGKLVDLKDHIERAHNLRERLTFSGDRKSSWELKGEAELTAIVDAADSWLHQYKPFVDGDNRRNKNRRCLSISKLREIVAEEKEIFANLGPAAVKMARILTQAEHWYNEHRPLLQRCNLEERNEIATKPIVDPAEMKNAVQAATSSISLDLEEAMALKKLAERIQHWFGQVGTVVKPKSKKQYQKFTVDEILELINESTTLPINVENEVLELRSHLRAVEEWKSHATKDLDEIGTSFLKIQEKMIAAYGPPSKFNIDLLVKNSDWGAESTGNESEQKEPLEDNGVESATSTLEASSTKDGPPDVIAQHDCSGERTTIQKLQAEARDIGVATIEAELLDLFDGISKWWLRSLKYLKSPREVFDKRYFGAFDRFTDDGDRLVSTCTTYEKKCIDSAEGSCESTWSNFVIAQLDRMKILRSERAKFVAWCDQAKEILADEKKLTLEKLKSLVKNSQKFPPLNDMVQEVRVLAEEVSKWSEQARPIILSGKKLDMPTAKALVEAGEKLKVNTEELRTLRAALKAVRKWVNRVKKCDLDQGDTKISTVTDLINEHESLLIEMPDDLARLQQATQAYCICRRPYEGFMIGCDECGEWYHGPCIGVSQARADRFDKFVCVRCSMKNLFKNSAVGAVDITKKWTSRKCLKKARQVEHQKHQRKVRKETKDMEKLQKKLEKLRGQKSPQKNASENPKAINTVGGNASSDLTAKKPADKSTTLVADKPDETPAAAVADETPNEKMPDKAPETPVGTVVDKQSETTVQTVVDKPGDTASDMVSKKSAEALAETVAEKIAETPAETPAVEAPVETPAENATGKSSDKDEEHDTKKPVEAHTKGSEKPQDEMQSEIDKISNTMRQIQERLVDLQNNLKEQKQMEATEDKNAEKLRKWCIRVRSFVLIPSNDEFRENARPPLDGSISKMMESVLSEAEFFGVASLNDVDAMRNLFKCMSWSLLGLSIINRKPTLEEMKMLLSRAAELRLPDEKALKTMKVMVHRTEQVRCKIEKILVTRPGESKPIKQSLLNELVASSESVALIIPESKRIYATIENKGIPPVVGEESDSEYHVNHGCISAHGHDPRKLWPPFALFGSPEVIEVLGAECSLIPEDTSVLVREESKVTVDQPKECTAQVQLQLQTTAHATEVTSSSVRMKSLSPTVVQSEEQNTTETQSPSMEVDKPVSPTSTPTDRNAVPVADTIVSEAAAGPEAPIERASQKTESQPIPEADPLINSTSMSEISVTEATPKVTASIAATVVKGQTEDTEMLDVQASDASNASEIAPAVAEEAPAGTSSEKSSATTGGASPSSANGPPPPVPANEEAAGQEAQDPPISAASESAPATTSEAPRVVSNEVSAMAGRKNHDAAASEIAIAAARDRLIAAMREVPTVSTADAAVAVAKERLIATMEEVPISSSNQTFNEKQETAKVQLPIPMDTDNE